MSIKSIQADQEPNKIKILRKEHNLTQQALADMLGCSKRTIEQWENNGRDCKEWIYNLIKFYLENR